MQIQRTSSFIQQFITKKKTYLHWPISLLQPASYFEGILRPEAGCNAAPW